MHISHVLTLLTGCTSLLVPGQPFDPANVPAPPDYDDPAAWAALPERADGADRVPAGETDRQDSAAVDVFYIHPTTLISRKYWNQPLDLERTNDLTDTVITAQAAAYNGAGRIWAPRYRQASVGYALTDDTESADQAFLLAYSDVHDAFQHWLDNADTGRPILLAAHSQGSQHLTHLVAEFVSGTELADRLVAAYIIGSPVPHDWLERVAPDLAECTGPTDTGCVLSWQTVGQGTHELTDYDGRARAWYPDGFESLAGKTMLCLNPLTFEAGQGARSDHEGAVTFKNDEPPEPVSGIVAGACSSEGFFEIEKPDDRAYRSRRQDYHIHDYGLFWMDLRSNAIERSAAFTAAL